MAQERFWSIRAGEDGQETSLFLQQSITAIRWEKMGDLRLLDSTKDAIKALYAERYPQGCYDKDESDDSFKRRVDQNSGTLNRFLSEINIGDFIFLLNPQDSWVYLGQVRGDYNFDLKMPEEMVHIRYTHWKIGYPKNIFTDDLLNSIRSRQTLISLDKFGDEILRRISVAE